MSKTTNKEKIGLIKWFGDKRTNKKYGFISDITNTEYFFHYQCLSQKVTSNKNFSIEKDLVQDKIVFFETEKKPKGDIAKNIVLLEQEDDIHLLFKFYIDLKLTGQMERSCFIPLEKKLKELSNTFSTETYNQLLNKFKEIFHEKMQKLDDNYVTKKYLKDIILNFFQKNINDLEIDSTFFSPKEKILLHLNGVDIKLSISDYKQCKAMLTSEQNNKVIDEICSDKNYTLENLLDIFDFNVLYISSQIYILETLKKYSIDYKKISTFISKDNTFLLYINGFDIEFDIRSYKEYIFSTGDENKIKNFLSELCSCNKFNMDDLCKILDINNIDFSYQKYIFNITQNKVDFNKILEFVTLDKTITYLWLKYPQLEIQFNRNFIEFINDFSVEEQSLFIKRIFLEISKNKTTTDIFNDIKSNYDSIVLVLYIIKDILDRNSKNEKINKQGIIHQFLSHLLEKYKETKDINSDYLKNSIENISFFDKCYGVYDLEENRKSNALSYKIANTPAHISVLKKFHYFCDGQKEPPDWLQKTIDYFKKRKFPEHKYAKYLYIDKEIKDRWKCSTHCYKPARFNLESSNLVECFNKINIPVSDEEYCIYAGIVNKIRIYIPHLVCNKCGHILQFNTKNNYAAERITHFICSHCSTDNTKDDDIYINHCSNSECFNIIDSRYSHRCKREKNSNIGLSLFVCNYCLDCCHQDQVSMYNNDGLREGHREHGIICCPKCGEHLTTYETYYNDWNQYLQTLRTGITKYGDRYFIVPKNNEFIDKKIIDEIFEDHEYSEDCCTKEKLEELLSGKIINSSSYPDNFLFIQQNKNKNIFLICKNCLNTINYDRDDNWARTNSIKRRHHLFFNKE